MGQCCSNEEMTTLHEVNLDFNVDSTTAIQAQKVVLGESKEGPMMSVQNIEAPVKE